jgi:hypothetical protein
MFVREEDEDVEKKIYSIYSKIYIFSTFLIIVSQIDKIKE